MLTALLVDDEPLANERMRGLLADCGGVNCIGTAGSVATARKALETLAPDVIFLDMEMPGGTGLDLLPSVPEGTQVVFVTAYEKYAVEAFAAAALDYLVKPVNPERLSETLRRVKRFADLQRLQPTAANEPSEPSPGEDDDDNPVAIPAGPGGSGERGLGDTIHVRLRHSRLLAAMTIDRICWIESLRNYTRVCLRNPGRVVLFRRRLGEWEGDLPAGVFARLGRSLLVRTDAIVETEFKSRNEKVLKFGAGIEPLVIGRLAAMRLRDILDGEGEEAP
ncbi:MAG: LytTR family DNA-binding domain-containing protein [Planctomycetota bacterium]|nr:LytTR family DNA-binding domain-containing protein [Planctomycetota bacterium]